MKNMKNYFQYPILQRVTGPGDCSKIVLANIFERFTEFDYFLILYKKE